MTSQHQVTTHAQRNGACVRRPLLEDQAQQDSDLNATTCSQIPVTSHGDLNRKPMKTQVELTPPLMPKKAQEHNIAIFPQPYSPPTTSQMMSDIEGPDDVSGDLIRQGMIFVIGFTVGMLLGFCVKNLWMYYSMSGDGFL